MARIIKTKFKLGEKVWFLRNNLPKSSFIEKMVISCTSSGEDSNKGITKYYMRGDTTSSFTDEEIFTSKEDVCTYVKNKYDNTNLISTGKTYSEYLETRTYSGTEGYNINCDYNVGESVWVMYNNRLYHAEVTMIDITLDEDTNMNLVDKYYSLKLYTDQYVDSDGNSIIVDGNPGYDPDTGYEGVYFEVVNYWDGKIDLMDGNDVSLVHTGVSDLLQSTKSNVRSVNTSVIQNESTLEQTDLSEVTMTTAEPVVNEENTNTEETTDTSDTPQTRTSYTSLGSGLTNWGNVLNGYGFVSKYTGMVTVGKLYTGDEIVLTETEIYPKYRTLLKEVFNVDVK
jgi:hypothetical protein